NNIAKHSGFLGGARVTSNGLKIMDPATFPINQYTLTYTNTSNREFYWINGPEAGLSFYKNPSYRLFGDGKIPGVYENFANPTNVPGTTSREPNNGGVQGNSTSGAENFLEFAYSVRNANGQVVNLPYWNDLPATGNALQVTGAYIEYSEYGDMTNRLRH
ncbi:hypothetical protein, partial [Acinetobacter baumannii]|uniref:hypothetical protein n=1 Tax=Acinetobacter baumannii TaxID=470 RepID=UPI001AECDFC7